MTPVVQVEGLSIAFNGVEVTSDVGFHVNPGESVALVGESGCGKSVTARSLLQLLPSTATVRAQKLEVLGASIPSLGPRALRSLRGRSVGFIFQNPMTALNPVYPIGEQIAERLRRYRGLDRRSAWRAAVKGLDMVGIPDAARRVSAYPHQLSGGMRQRVVIAIALACDPDVLIADEPTTALDVTIQAQLMRVLADQQAARKMAILLITHDLGLVAQSVDRVVVMYAGQVVEDAPVEAIFTQPKHPYTRGLLRSVPGVTPPDAEGRLWAIPGAVPPPEAFPRGCRFAPRCARADDECRTNPIKFEHHVRCLKPHDDVLSA